MDPLTRMMDDGTEGRARRVFGLVFAEVTEISDEGYILRYLSINYTDESAPARVATLMAGGGRGTFLMPEIGDEVVVGFENGSIDNPVILGALWSDVDTPPEQADTSASNNVRTIVSRAGHEVTLDDSPGRGEVRIRSAGGHEITLTDTASQSGITIKNRAGVEIALNDTPPGIVVRGPTVQIEATSIQLTGSVSIAGSVSLAGAAGSAAAEVELPQALTVRVDPPGPLVTTVPTGLRLNTTPPIATTQLIFDGVSWNHGHGTPVSPPPPVGTP